MVRFSILTFPLEGKRVLIRLNQTSPSLETLDFVEKQGAIPTIVTTTSKVCDLKNVNVTKILDEQDLQNNPLIAHRLAEQTDFFINDALDIAHEKRTSTDVITHFVPSAAGFNIERTVSLLTDILHNPCVWFIGSETQSVQMLKLGVKTASHVLTSMPVGCSLLRGMGFNVGVGIVDASIVQQARELTKNNTICLPNDFYTKRNELKLRHTLDYEDECISVGEKTENKYLKIIGQNHRVVVYGTFDISHKNIIAQLAKTQVICVGKKARQSLQKYAIPISLYIPDERIVSDLLEGKKIPVLRSLEKNYATFHKTITRE